MRRDVLYNIYKIDIISDGLLLLQYSMICCKILCDKLEDSGIVGYYVQSILQDLVRMRLML